MSSAPRKIRDDAASSTSTAGIGSLVVGWKPQHAALWGRAPVCVSHNLHTSSLFDRSALASLIEKYPRQHYSIIHMGPRSEDRRLWREGELGGMPGHDVIDAIEHGRLWLNLRHVGDVDGRYAAVVNALFDELEVLAPGFTTKARGCGIIVSSPNAQVYYHADLPGHALLQLIGRKKIFFYPANPPFITPEELERIAISGLEVGIPYSAWFDEYASVFEFEPGQMIHWPHTAPHRIENYDCLNVSVTLDFVTPEIRRRQMVILANGIMRHRFGWVSGRHLDQRAKLLGQSRFAENHAEYALDEPTARFRAQDSVQVGPRRAGSRRGRLTAEGVSDNNSPPMWNGLQARSEICSARSPVRMDWPSLPIGE